jgi:chromatin segregation and condensation protein Rec8/ScpA/Scc1 (kleisin family)
MDAVFATAESRSQLVAIFLALLELIRSERVTVDDDGGLQLREGRLPEPGEEKQDADS